MSHTPSAHFILVNESRDAVPPSISSTIEHRISNPSVETLLKLSNRLAVNLFVMTQRGRNFQGSMTSTPAARNGAMSRVATANPPAAAIAVMYASAIGSPLPTARARRARSAWWRAASVSNDRMRPENSDTSPSTARPSAVRLRPAGSAPKPNQSSASVTLVR